MSAALAAARKAPKLSQIQFVQAVDAMRANANWFRGNRPTPEEALAKLKEICKFTVPGSALNKLRVVTGIKWVAQRSDVGTTRSRKAPVVSTSDMATIVYMVAQLTRDLGVVRTPEFCELADRFLNGKKAA